MSLYKKLKMVSEQDVFCEQHSTLRVDAGIPTRSVGTRKHFSPSKMARFLATWQNGDTDYLTIRDRLFEGETVETLYSQIKEFESRC